jgi:hypothetical protein
MESHTNVNSMILPPPPFKRRLKVGLTILESLVLLITSILLVLIIVPVLLVKSGYISPEPTTILKEGPPKMVQEPKPIPSQLRSLPEAPKLPLPTEPDNK